MLYPGQKTSSSKVVVELVYEEARPGIFSFKLYELVHCEMLTRWDSSTHLSNFNLAKTIQSVLKQSKTVGPSTCEGGAYVGRQGVLEGRLAGKILDEDLGEDKPIASTQMCLLPYMNTLPQQAKEDWFDMFYVTTRGRRIKKNFIRASYK